MIQLPGVYITPAAAKEIGKRKRKEPPADVYYELEDVGMAIEKHGLKSIVMAKMTTIYFGAFDDSEEFADVLDELEASFHWCTVSAGVSLSGMLDEVLDVLDPSAMYVTRPEFWIRVEVQKQLI